MTVRSRLPLPPRVSIALRLMTMMNTLERPIPVPSFPRKWVKEGAISDLPNMMKTIQASILMPTTLICIQGLGIWEIWEVTYLLARQVPRPVLNDRRLLRGLTNLIPIAIVKAPSVIHRHIVLVVSSHCCQAMSSTQSRLIILLRRLHSGTHSDSSMHPTHLSKELEVLHLPSLITTAPLKEVLMTGSIRQCGNEKGQIVSGLLASEMRRITAALF